MEDPSASETVRPIRADEAPDIITCPICHDVFNDPVMTSCFHVFCRECIRKVEQSQGASQTGLRYRGNVENPTTSENTAIQRSRQVGLARILQTSGARMNGVNFNIRVNGRPINQELTDTPSNYNDLHQLLRRNGTVDNNISGERIQGTPISANEPVPSAQSNGLANPARESTSLLATNPHPPIPPPGELRDRGADAQPENRLEEGQLTCPICRQECGPLGRVAFSSPETNLTDKLSSIMLKCPNSGCTVAPFPANEWKRHQESCLYTMIECRHKRRGCKFVGLRKNLQDHLEKCAYEELEGFINGITTQIEEMGTAYRRLEDIIRLQSAQIASYRRLYISNIFHYSQMIWTLMTRSLNSEFQRDHIRNTPSVIWLQSLITVLPLIMILFGLIGWELDVGLRPAIQDNILYTLPQNTIMRSRLNIILLVIRAFFILPSAIIMLRLEGWRNSGWNKPIMRKIYQLIVLTVSPAILRSSGLLMCVIGATIPAISLEWHLNSSKFYEDAVVWIISDAIFSPKPLQKLIFYFLLEWNNKWLVDYFEKTLNQTLQEESTRRREPVRILDNLGLVFEALEKINPTRWQMARAIIQVLFMVQAPFTLGTDVLLWYISIRFFCLLLNVFRHTLVMIQSKVSTSLTSPKWPAKVNAFLLIFSGICWVSLLIRCVGNSEIFWTMLGSSVRPLAT